MSLRRQRLELVVQRRSMTLMEHHGYYHGIAVWELRKILDKLDELSPYESLVLVPNAVKNLAIIADNVYVGFVDLGSHEVTIFQETIS